jgi:catechol 2,3-dioxygenase-like lactoylglutathione lyase family enzyme
MLRDARLVSMVPTSNRERAQRFYEETLGLTLLSADDFALVFQVSCATLRVVSVQAVEPAAFTTVGWHVTNVETVLAELISRGVEPVRFEGMTQDDVGIWTAPNGDRVAWFRDPDGNLLSVTSVG